MIAKLLERAKGLAQDLSGNELFWRQHGCTTGGMASVGIRWNPYEGKWEAHADWSNNYAIRSEPNEFIVNAIEDLINILDLEKVEV